MFSKESVLKSFIAINNNKYNKYSIFDNCESKIVDKKAYLKAFNEHLVTDELVDYINENCEELPIVAFGDTNLLGELGKTLERYNRSNGLLFGPALYHEGKAFCVGDSGVEGCAERHTTPCTYIFDDGTFAVVNKIEYENYDIDKPFITVVYPNNEDAPLLNNVDSFFPEDYQGFWDV